MSGNVYECHSDWHDENYYKYCDTLNTNEHGGNVMVYPTGPLTGDHRVFRLGCFGSPSTDCIVSRHWNMVHDGRNLSVGFRPAMNTPLPVAGVSMQPYLYIIKGVTDTLIAAITPAGAANKNVSWSSDNTEIATVNNKGIVTGVAADSTTVRVTTEDGNKTAACEVTVVPIEMVYVQSGTFTRSDETHSQKVTLTTDYLIGKYEVTQGLWKAVMEYDNNPSYHKGNDRYPVDTISYNDIVNDFLPRLNQKTAILRGDSTYKLPTEAQWEFAARVGTKSAHYSDNSKPCHIFSGSDTVENVAWFGGYLNNDPGNSRNESHVVGVLQPDELGTYDMSGNLYEWCSDWYGSYTSDLQRDPTSLESGSFRVDRDGDWDVYANFCAVSDVTSATPTAVTIPAGSVSRCFLSLPEEYSFFVLSQEYRNNNYSYNLKKESLCLFN